MSPRAKLRRREFTRRAGSSSSIRSFLASNVRCITGSLFLLSRSLQPFWRNPLLAGDPPKWRHIRQQHSLASSVSSAARHLVVLRDLPIVTRFVLFDRDVSSEAVPSVIYVGTGRRRKAHVSFIQRFVLIIALCAQTKAVVAQEQEVETPITIFDPESGDGVKIAPALDLHAQLTASAVYDSNIYNTVDNEREDLVAVLAPRVALVSNLSRHAFRLAADAEIRRYVETTDENSEQYSLTADGLLDLGDRIRFWPAAGFARRIERRGTAGDEFLSDSPVVFYDKYVSLEAARTGGKLEARAKARIYKADYSDTRLDGVPIDLSSRDVEIRRGNLRASYRVSEALRVYGEINGNQVRYDRDVGYSRDSSGYSLLGGVQFEVNNLADAEVGVGYIRQNFENPAYEAVDGITFWLRGKWTPRPYWQVSASAEKTINSSPREDTPAIVQTAFDLNVKRAVGDRLLLEGSAGMSRDNFWNIPRTDTHYYGKVSAHYRLADPIGLIASVGYREREGRQGTQRSYEGFTATLGVSAKW